MIKAIEFDERLKAIVERYNNRDRLVFTNEGVSDFINGLIVSTGHEVIAYNYRNLESIVSLLN